MVQNTGRVWLIGGTQESAQLATAIAHAHLPCIVTVTTLTAKSLYPKREILSVWVGCLSPEQLPQFLQAHGITVILDASHPYAVEISELAIATAARLNIPYLRYERPVLDLVETLHATSHRRPETGDWSSFVYLDSFETLLTGNYLIGHRVLLTIGYRPLAFFHDWQEQATLFARILPSQTALAAAFAAGFTPNRVMALRPPATPALEKALWQQWQISLVVTKASGEFGGEAVKRRIAAELNVQLITIARPHVHYPQQTSDLETALKFCHQHLHA
ncbi:MAG: cobalt-precorrin-6A reductase [Cyanothece sp. SIO1E1]|nr:cobalt-precorrin-6A reductase [Cyanothece sp. SIO1E1]